MSSYHAGAEAAFAAVPTPDNVDSVAAAQAAVTAIFEQRGSYGCEYHLWQAAMRRVSSVLYRALPSTEQDPTGR